MIGEKPKSTFLNKLIFLSNWAYLFVVIMIGFNYYFPLGFLSVFFILNVLYPYLLFGLLSFIFQTYLQRNGLLLVINISVFLSIFLLLGPIYVFGDSISDKTENSVRFLTFNSLELEGYGKIRNKNLSSTFEKFIENNNPDVICLQEFSRIYKIPSIIKNYPYYYIHRKTPNNDYSPLTIISKYPIIGKGSLDFPNTDNNAIYADLVFPKDTIRVYNVHLQSLKVRPGSIKRERPWNLLNRLRTSYKRQLQQAEMVKKHNINSPYRTVLCGDFNNTQYSGIVRLLGNGMKDSFIEQGNGFGWTYYFKFLPFRIDYIFADENLEIVDHQNYYIELSDHYPVMATINLGSH